jgi:hypothetical protein
VEAVLRVAENPSLKTLRPLKSQGKASHIRLSQARNKVKNANLLLVASLSHFSVLMMKAVCTFEMSVKFYWTI